MIWRAGVDLRRATRSPEDARLVRGRFVPVLLLAIVFIAMMYRFKVGFVSGMFPLLLEFLMNGIATVLSATRSEINARHNAEALAISSKRELRTRRAR